MQFSELRARIGSIKFVMLREDSNDYFEAVVSCTELPKLETLFKDFFGSPAWPSAQEPPSGIKSMIEESGGIHSGQTLYLYNQGGLVIFAMLWPWQDMEHTTVKIVNRSEDY